MIEPFHYITHRDHITEAEQVCKNGGKWIQLRIKNKEDGEWLEIAKEVKKICTNYKAKLIINDNIQITLETNADGVHLGKNDLPVEEARKLLGKTCIIGTTANTFEDIMKTSETSADYIGLGPYNFTRTKEKISPILGLQGIKEILFAKKHTGLNIPVIIIGGIDINDVEDIMDAGADGIAISSAISNATNIGQAAKNFLTMINRHSKSVTTTI